MIKRAILAAGVIALSSMGAAQAQQLVGAQLDYEYNWNIDNSFSQKQLRGSAELSFGGGFGLQLDVVNWGYDGLEPAYVGGMLHGFYNVSPGLSVGAFAGRDDWAGTLYNIYGGELAYDSGPFSTELFASRYLQDGGGYEGAFYGARAEYDWQNNISLFAGATLLDDSGGSISQGSIGARYMFNDNFSASLDFSSLRDGGGTEQSVGVSFGYYYGAGTRFGGRDWTSVLSAY